MPLQELLTLLQNFKHRNQESLPRKLYTPPQTFTYYDTTLSYNKTPLLRRKQTFKVREVATRESGQEVPWVVNTPVREHNKQFRATHNSLWGSNLDRFCPKPPSLSQEEMKCGKRKRGKKEVRVEVVKVFYFSFLPLSSIIAGRSPKALNQYPKFLLIPRLQTCIYQPSPFQTPPLHLWISPHPFQSDAFWLQSPPLLSLSKLIHLIFPYPYFLSDIMSLIFFIIQSKCHDSHIQ